MHESVVQERQEGADRHGRGLVSRENVIGAELASSGVSILKLFFARRSHSRIILSAEPVASTCSSIVMPSGIIQGYSSKKGGAGAEQWGLSYIRIGGAPAEAVDALLVVFKHLLLALLVRVDTPDAHIRRSRCSGKLLAVTTPPQRLDNLRVPL